MAGERNFLQVPPDSTGKRVRMVHTAEIFYNSLDPVGYSWDVGARYYTTFSDSAVYYIHVHGVHELTSTTGILEVHYAKAARYNNLNPTVSADITDEDGTTVAVVESYKDIYINANHIIGFDNPEHGVDVDATGSMNIRFSEGLPQLDAFGKLRTSGATILGDYVFSENSLPQYFTSTIWGRGVGASIGHDINRHTLTLTTPSTVTAGYEPTSDIDSGTLAEGYAITATHTSDTYHHYFPGFSHNITMTVALQDGDVEGVAQKWGYFDDKNGYYFRVYDNGGLEFVIRSSATGTLKETVISRTQTRKYTGTTLDSTTSDGWNGDLVDGSGDSGKILDLTDDNIYWIDIQWLGAGRVRFGTYHEGQRVVIHEHYNDVNNGFPHSQTGSLPIRYQQYVIRNSTVTQATTMYAWCVSIISEAAVDLNNQGYGQVESFEVTFDPANLNDTDGDNDTGMGDRVGVSKVSVSSSGTTLTVPNITGIKPGYRLEITGGTGEVDNSGRGTTVLEIINSTTIVLNKAPTVALSGATVRFYLNVDKEYHLVGVLAPKIYIGSQTSNKNRTIYQPKSVQCWAYHADGSDAFCEVEIYTQPIISGNDVSITSTGTTAPLQSIEPNNPYVGVVSYEFNDGRVNYFGSGLHNSVIFVKGVSETQDISHSYSNYQAGAFKIASDNGGNNRCPVARIYQSATSSDATVIQINTAPTGVDFTNHRENQTALYFQGIPGAIGTDATYGLNYDAGRDNKYYVRHLDIEKLELYEDQAFTIPVDTSFATTGIDPSSNAGGSVNLGPAGTATVGGGLTWRGNTGSVATGGFIISGYGDQLYFAVVAKPVGPSVAGTSYQTTHGEITVHFKLTWNEITQ